LWFSAKREADKNTDKYKLYLGRFTNLQIIIIISVWNSKVSASGPSIIPIITFLKGLVSKSLPIDASSGSKNVTYEKPWKTNRNSKMNNMVFVLIKKIKKAFLFMLSVFSYLYIS